ncbi:MAG: hypothetical protein WCY38_00330 [Endomicrobiia bacterium]
MENKKDILDIYGINVLINGTNDVVAKILSDFAYFNSNNTNRTIDLSLNINISPPPYEKIPEITASMYKTDCISYDKNGIRYVDYLGKALVIYNINENQADIFSLSPDLLYEITYLFVHSRVGEMLDMKGFHRIHSCAFSFEDKIYICMLPQGGGKSTLLMELLKNDTVKLLSDDTPFIDKNGYIYPFPIRIGLCNDIQTNYIPEKFITIFNRRKFGQKKLISYEFFKDRIETRKLPTIILYGKRFFSNTSEIVKKNRFCAFQELFKNCIIGFGLPQVIEYFLIGGFKDSIQKSYLIILRLYACIMLLIKNKQVYCFYLGNDKNLNAEKFFKFFHK